MLIRIVKRSLIIGLLLLAAAVAGGVAYVQTTGTQLLSVQSGSMEPVLHKGDLVTARRTPVDQLRTGDVITFVSPRNARQTITHRIVEVPAASNGWRIITKGDANAHADPPIAVKAIVGKVGHAFPAAGQIVDLIRRPVGLVLVMYVPAAVVIGLELQRLARHYQKQRPYVLWGRRPRAWRLGPRPRLFAALKATLLCVGVGVLGALPVNAALLSSATLTNNSLQARRPTPHIMLRRVTFSCSLDNTATVNKLPTIIMYNPTATDIVTSGWYIESAAGRVVTFPKKTVFDARDNYDIEPDLTTGVAYAGDHLVLKNAAGQAVDAISWGTDTAYLNPALPNTVDGTTFRRLNLFFDTDQALDWQVSVTTCS